MQTWFYKLISAYFWLALFLSPVAVAGVLSWLSYLHVSQVYSELAARILSGGIIASGLLVGFLWAQFVSRRVDLNGLQSKK